MTGKITIHEDEDFKYTIVPNEPIRRADLSWKAKGLYAYLVGMKKDWIIYKSDLANRSLDGYDSMIAGWKELEGAGYIKTIEIRDNGLFKGYDYIVYKSPIRDFTESVLPESGNPQLSNTSSKIVLIEDIDTKVSNVVLPTATPTVGNSSERCRLFLDKFNSMRILNGKPSKFRFNNSICASLRLRLKKYTSKEILLALTICLVDDFHIKSKLKYVTPEYILRENIIEKYLNMNVEKEEEQKRGLVH